MTASNPIVILGSSSSAGKTRKAIDDLLQDGPDVPVIDLNDYEISYYDYTGQNNKDDYIPLMKRVVQHNPIILATPVYWYTMSAQLKTFLDRLSDLLTGPAKDIGRQLRGKRLYVICTYDTSLPEGFELPFSQTANYLGMSYLGCSYLYRGKDPLLTHRNVFDIAKAMHVLGMK